MSSNKPMPWIKQYPTRLHDVRLASLNDRQQLRYFQLYLLAGQLNADGAFIQDDKQLNITGIAYLLRVNDVKQLEKDLAALKKSRLIKVNGHGPYIAEFKDEQINWMEQQRNNRERQKRFKQLHKDNALVTRDAPVSDTEVTLLDNRQQTTELDIDKDSLLVLSAAVEKLTEHKFTITDADHHSLSTIIKDVKADWVLKAIKVAQKNKKTSAAYVIGILKNWRVDHGNNGKRNTESTDRPTPRRGQTHQPAHAATSAAAKRIIANKKKANV